MGQLLCCCAVGELEVLLELNVIADESGLDSNIEGDPHFLPVLFSFAAEVQYHFSLIKSWCWILKTVVCVILQMLVKSKRCFQKVWDLDIGSHDRWTYSHPIATLLRAALPRGDVLINLGDIYRLIKRRKAYDPFAAKYELIAANKSTVLYTGEEGKRREPLTNLRQIWAKKESAGISISTLL